MNGHGKSTLLRTVLFFYLGTNEKAPYALHETKSDFVSHYLGEPPGYLIYEVTRGEGQPGYHIAVTRPAARIQFHFVDSPFRRDYYVDGRVVLPIERVQERWRDARCAVDTLLSYEDFSHRIYGIVPSTYAVFRPAPRGTGHAGVLPRIISGIFTVSQLDADKLKSALTCGVRSERLRGGAGSCAAQESTGALPPRESCGKSVCPTRTGCRESRRTGCVIRRGEGRTAARHRGLGSGGETPA